MRTQFHFLTIGICECYDLRMTVAPHPSLHQQQASGTTKVAVKIWQPLLEKFDACIETACLRRDAYLARLLAREIPLLDAEVAVPNSPAALRYVSDHLSALDRKTVTLTLPTSQVEQLKDVCDRKGISRDAFFNRVILLLAANRKTIDRLLFPDWPAWRTYVWEEFKQDGEFRAGVFDPLNDPSEPFWAMREALAKQAKDVGDLEGAQLYTTFFDQRVGNGDLVGFNTYVPDELVPGTQIQVAKRRELDELLGGLTE